MMVKAFAIVTLALFPLVAAAWPDCDATASQGPGPFGASTVNTYTYTLGNKTHPIILHYPTASLPAGATGWPVVVFMHGMTLGQEWYVQQLQHFASHGFVVAFPFIKDQEHDDAYPLIPLTETDANGIYASFGLLQSLANGTLSLPTDLKGSLDMSNVGLAGHSMGGEDTIRAMAKIRIPDHGIPLQNGTVKVAIAQHPSLCTFPPPYPATINKKEIDAASQNGALLMFTAENDFAFLNKTPKVEQECWQAATGPAIFASFTEAICDTFPPCDFMNASDPNACKKIHNFGTGHLCACSPPGLGDSWISPELQWVTTALRLYLQQDNATSTACSTYLWGDGKYSLKKDPHVLLAEMHG